MSVLLHAVIKDWDNSGLVYDDFYCPECLESRVLICDFKEILRLAITTPKYLSRLYPPLVNEPVCAVCGARFRHHHCLASA